MSGVVASAKTGEVQANKTAKVLKEMAGIDVWNKQTGEVKDMYSVMEELHGVWGNLNEDQRSAIAQTIAGKTQLNSFFALMGNWEHAAQYVKEYKEGLMVGSAEEEQARYLDSIQGKWASLKASLQGIANNLISSDFVKGLLDGLTKIAEVIEQITSSGFGSFAVGMTGIATAVGAVYSGFKKLKALGNVVDLLGGKSIADMTTTTAKATGTFSKFGTKVTTAMKSVGSSISAGVKSLGLFSSAGTTATTLVSAAFLALPYAIAGYVKYQEYANEKQIKESKETIKALEEQIATNEQASESAKKIVKEYDKLRNTTNKTAEEQERYAELTKQVAEIFPDLVSGYDSQGNPILELNGSLETYVRNLDKAIEKQKELTKSEQSKLANEQKEYLERIEGYREELAKAQQGTSTLNSSQYKDVFSGKIDVKKLKNVLEEREKAEKQSYEKSLEYYEQTQQAKADIMKDYQNKFQDSFGYTKANAEEQERLNSMFENLDLGNLDYKGRDVDAFLRDLTLLNDKLVQTTSEMGESEKAINKAEEAFGKTMNLKNYTDALVEAYEATGKIDNESFSQWVDGVREYAETTGDLEGANTQAMKMCETLEELTGIDAKTWFDGLDFNFEPVEEGTKKLNEFMQAYGTGVQNIGKGGMADKLNREFEQLRELPMELANELAENGEISAEFLINATAEMVTPVKELVDEIVEDGKITDEELEVLLQVQTEIENEGEVSEETKQKIKELFPEMTDEEIEARFSVKADIENEQAIDKLLKDRDKLSQNVESAIRVNVENAEQAELLYDTLEKVPKEKRIEVANNFGEVQQICRELGINIDELPEEAIVKMITEGDTEALSKCKNLQEIVDYLNKTFNLNLEITENGEVIEKVKEEVETLPPEKKVEIEIKKSGADPQEIRSEIETVPPEKRSNIEIQQSGAAPQEIRAEIETIPPEKTINITANNSDAIEKANTANSTVNSVKQTSPIKINANNSDAKQKATETSSTINSVKQTSPVKINANNSDAISKSSAVKTSLSGIKNKKISITASVAGALSSIGSVISKLRQLGNKSVSVTANVTYKRQGVVNTPNGTMSADAFGTFGHDSSFDVMADAPIGDFTTHAGAVASRSTASTPITTWDVYLGEAPLHAIDLYTELKNRIDAVGSSLDLLSEKAERATGDAKISYLQQQIALYKEEKELQLELEKNLKRQQGVLKSSLQNYGFQFTGDGNLKNYEEQLMSMEKTLDSYEKAYEKAQEAERLYEGDNESRKKSLSNATDAAKKRMDEYNDKLSNAKKILDEYLEITYSGIPDAKVEWERLESSIEDAKEEIKQAQNDMREFANEKWKLNFELNIQSIDRELTDLENKIDLIDAKLERENGTTALSLEELKISYLNEQMDIYLKKQKELESVARSYKTKLKSYGIAFNGDEMTNYEEIMKKLHAEESDMYDEVSELAKEYFELLDEEIPKTALMWQELNNEIMQTKERIKEMAEEKLEITADIEEKITEIYKKELDEQINSMKKATDKRIELLEKERDAYNEARADAKYEDTLLEQQEKINDLQKQISIAERDTSINGQQRLRELMEQLEEEQKNFQELTQDHLDDTINDLYDREIDRIQNESDEAIKELEDKWSDEKIAQIVADTLASGIFVGINGEVSSLKDKLLETTIDSGEAFTVLGAKIQSELCDNLQIALETMKNLANVYQDAGLGKFDITTSPYNAVSDLKKNNENITINSNPVFNIDSNGAFIDYDEIQRMINESNDVLIEKIIKY